MSRTIAPLCIVCAGSLRGIGGPPMKRLYVREGKSYLGTGWVCDKGHVIVESDDPPRGFYICPRYRSRIDLDLGRVQQGPRMAPMGS